VRDIIAKIRMVVYAVVMRNMDLSRLGIVSLRKMSIERMKIEVRDMHHHS